MKVTTEELDTRELLIKVELDKEQLERAMRKAAKEISKQVVIPGFRKGKAPYRLVIARVGENVVFDYAVDILADELYPKLLDDLGLEPSAPGTIEEAQKDPPMLVFKVPLMPEVNLGDYRDIRITPEEIKVTDGEVENVLRRIQWDNAVWKSVDRPARYGDMVVVDWELDIEGEKHSETERSIYLGTDSALLPGLNDELVGLAPGDEKEFTLRYWEDAESRFAGKKVKVHVKVHEVKEAELPELNDEFARSLGDFESLEDLKEQIRREIEEAKRSSADERYKDMALDALVDSAEVKIPPVFIEEEKAYLLEEMEKHYLQEKGIDLEQLRKFDPEEYEIVMDMVERKAFENVRRNLVLAEFARQEGIEVSDEEVDELLEKVIKQAGSERERKAIIMSKDLRSYVWGALLFRKVADKIASIARGEAETAESELQEAPEGKAPTEGEDTAAEDKGTGPSEPGEGASSESEGPGQADGP